MKTYENFISEWGINKYNVGDYIMTNYPYKNPESETLVGSLLSGKIIAIDEKDTKTYKNRR